MENSIENNRPSDFEILVKFVTKEFILLQKILKNHWVALLITGLISGLSLGSFIYFSKGKYTSVTRFFLNSDPLSTGNNFNSISAVTNLLGIGDALNTVSERSRQTFYSENIMRRVLFNEVVINGQKDLLVNHYIHFAQLRKDWKKSNEENIQNITNYQLKPEDVQPQNWKASLQMRLVLNKILDIKNLFFGVGLDPKSGIFTISVQHENQDFALLFNEILNQEFINFNNSIILGLGKKNENFVKFKVDSLEKNIRILNLQLSRFQDENKFLLLEQDKQKIRDINKQIEQNYYLYAEAKKNQEILELLNNNLKPAVTYISKPSYPLNFYKRSVLKYGIFGMFLGFFLSYAFFRLKLLKEKWAIWMATNFPMENNHH